MTRAALGALRSLARTRGVMTSYEDAAGTRRSASPETLLAVLRAMGEPVATLSDAPAALRLAREAMDAEAIAPVIVDWAGARSVADVNPSALARGRRAECTLTLESGEVRTWRLGAGERTLTLPSDLPVGRHVLTLRGGRKEASSVVLTAPPRVGSSHLLPGRPRDLGVFMPLHALRTERSWGTGDLTDLGAMARWARGHEASIVGTLPMLGSFLDEPFDPSPYAPISRLFFGELYLDPTASPDLALSTEARLLLGSGAFRRELDAVRDGAARGERGGNVDYRRAMALKRRVLEPLAAAAFENPHRRREIGRFAKAHRDVGDYAAFRAAVERSGATWQSWKGPAREGTLRRGRDFEAQSERYHLYCQFLLSEQLGELAATLGEAGAVLYLDLPIGVHGGGYDVWRHRWSFVTDVSVGAPPDPLAAGGQDWGFPPLHPHHSRTGAGEKGGEGGGHEYFSRCLRAHLAHARLLRIDHVMALHRLFWIPRGMEASEGVYVRYPDEELYAALSIEAHRAATASGGEQGGAGGSGGVRIVGENLGTVPEAVNRTMRRRHVLGMSIAQFSLTTEKVPLPEPPAETLAALNTHDTPTFAAFYHGLDLELRRELGLGSERDITREAAGRRKLRAALDRFAERAARVGGRDVGDDPAAAALRALLERLATSPAAVVLLNLEDLWLETRPQNVPGTTDERYPNWRRRSARALEEFDDAPGVAELLRSLATLRLMPTSLSPEPPVTGPARGGARRGRSRGGRA